MHVIPISNIYIYTAVCCIIFIFFFFTRLVGQFSFRSTFKVHTFVYPNTITGANAVHGRTNLLNFIFSHTIISETSRLVLRPDCAPRSECPQFGMPAERRPQFRVPNVPRSRISERAAFRIYEHTQCRVFESISLQRAYVIPCRKWGRPLCTGTPQRVGSCSEHAVLAGGS